MYMFNKQLEMQEWGSREMRTDHGIQHVENEQDRERRAR